MRKFSNLEKDIIKSLIKHDHVREQGLIQMATLVNDFNTEHDYNLSILIDSTRNQVMLSIPETTATSLRKKSLIVITIFNLLQFLVNEGLIIIVGEKQGLSLGQQYNNGQTSQIPEPIANFILENLTKYILVSEELNDMASSNFKSLEQIHHKEIIIISIIALLISMCLGIYSVYNSYENNKISDERYGHIIDVFNINANKIDTSLQNLKIEPSDYSASIKEVNKNLKVIEKEIKTLSGSKRDKH